MKRLGLGTTVVALLVSVAAACVAAASAFASAGGGPIPRAGDWEGTGSHGLPLSFALARRHGHLVATAIAIGAPRACPANARNAEAVPLSDVAYSGPGSSTGDGSSRAVLSGRVPGHGGTASLIGSFTSARSGKFSIQIKKTVGHCGWPKHTLTWQVRPAHRHPLADRTWSAALTGPGITSGHLKVAVASLGRVVDSVRSSFTCQSPTTTATGRFASASEWDFIRPNGRFYSATKGNNVKGHPTTWTGRFSKGALTGTLSIYDPCTNKLARAQFSSG